MPSAAGPDLELRLVHHLDLEKSVCGDPQSVGIARSGGPAYSFASKVIHSPLQAVFSSP